MVLKFCCFLRSPHALLKKIQSFKLRNLNDSTTVAQVNGCSAGCRYKTILITNLHAELRFVASSAFTLFKRAYWIWSSIWSFRAFANSLQIAADKDCRMRDSDHGALVMDWNLFAGTSSLKESIGRIFTKGILTEGTLTGASEVHGLWTNVQMRRLEPQLKFDQ